MSHQRSCTRTLERRYLKNECVDEYRRYHDAVWPELEELYRTNGVTAISCFMKDNELIVLYECDADVYAEKKAIIAKSPVEIRWQALMATFLDSTKPVTQFEEVYRLDA